MKLFGLLLVVLCSAMTGIYMASGLSKRVGAIENSISLLGMLCDRLRFLQPSMNQLIGAMASMEQFSATGYLVRCRDLLREGHPFPESWQRAVHESTPEIGKAQAAILLPLGEVLGSTDLDSQLAALGHARALLENRLADARSYRDRHAKMYQSLGVLCGLAIAILFV